jgi:UDP-N-acetylglucosamine enolpyruvyl transferase
MDKILVHGGHPLSGSIKVSGYEKFIAADPRRDAAHQGALHCSRRRPT